jgi:hypothetical protein
MTKWHGAWNWDGVGAVGQVLGALGVGLSLLTPAYSTISRSRVSYGG